MQSLAAIKSANEGTTLEFFERDGDYFSVRLRNLNFHGMGRVYNYEPFEYYLVAFFRDLANCWQGWQGKKEWSSLESELSLVAICDSIGHVSLVVGLRSGPHPFEWNLSTTLLLEAGQLDDIAIQIEKFFADV